MELLQLRCLGAARHCVIIGLCLGVAFSEPSVQAFPVITSVSPTSGFPGTSVAISGVDLGGAVEVDFGTAPALFTLVSANQIIATVPLDATSGPIAVVTTSGFSATFGDFLVSPRITDFSPL